MNTRTLSFLMSMAFVLPACGQLNTSHNRFRPEDVLKKQVEYADQGRPWTNMV